MHSAEPFEHRFVNDSSLPLPAPAPDPTPVNDAWRAEVASRVHSYRVRHNPWAAAKETPALDLRPTTGAPAAGENVADPVAGDAPAGPPVNGRDNLRQDSSIPNALDRAPRRKPREPADIAFDTNYYRRLNAQALEQTAEMTDAHPTSAKHGQTWGPLVDDQELRAEGEAPRPAEAETAADFDLELNPTAPGDACLERYRIQGEEATDCRTAVAPAPSSHTPFMPPAVALAPAQVPPTCDQPTYAAPIYAAPGAAPNLAPQQNLIVFPRPVLEPPLLPQPSRDELADPVHQRPRILEVPEDIMPCVQGSLFPEIRLDGEEAEVSRPRQPEFEIPLPVAPLSARLKAGMADWVVVMAAGGLFAAIAGRAMPELPHAKPSWMALAAVIVLLWVVYQHLFLLYAGRTVGMRIAGIRLSTFDGRPPLWNERRRRARFMLISLASVAIGFLWALVDEDSLCWHDRVSRTFPTSD